MTEVLIVGAGTGGLSVARELSKNPNVNITILEKGPEANDGEAYKYYSSWDREDLEIIRTTVVGGCSLVIAGNYIPVLYEELKNDYGIDLSSQFNQLKDEIGIIEMPKSHVGKTTQLLKDAAKRLDLELLAMPKGINPEKCQQCGKCAWGCPYGAKWSSIEDLKVALENGSTLITEEGAISLVVKENKVVGVNTEKGNTYQADIVILAAGGVVTPKLLRTAGIKAGETLSVDPFVTIGGYLKDSNQTNEIEMNSYLTFPNFVIATHTSQYVLKKVQKTHPDATAQDIASFMVKIADKCKGYVHGEEISKQLDFDDAAKLAEGCGVATSILVEAGVDIKSISSTHVRGAHMQSSARIGDIVDTNLKTEIDNLYVADGSVLPVAPGAPPIYTILALSRRLGQYLSEKL